MGRPLYCSVADAGVWEERGYGDGSTPVCDSAVLSCFHGCQAFLHRPFPPQSPPSHPRDLSLCSQQQPSPGVAPQSLNSSSQLLHLLGDLRPCPGYVWGCSKDCLILVPFRLPQISYFTLSLKCSSSDSNNCPDVGIRPLFQFPHPLKAGPVLLKRWKNRGLFFSLVPLTEFCMVLYILYCLSGTPVCSQLVFCMHFCV